MPAELTIALDVMGGDHGPPVVIPGAAISLERHPNSRYILVGDQSQIAPELARHPALAARSEVVHTDIAVAMDEKPSQALRKGRWKSSMWLAIEAVRDGRAHAVVSAGNTGALMAMSKFCLRTLPGIERPAIAAVWPTIDAECIVLDVGANVGADARQLIEFALMGAAMARALFSLDNPAVGLLNIGTEEVKGLEEIRTASQALRSMAVPFDYRGFIEGNNVGQGLVDVVVTEGFTGNIALKTAEGTARQIGAYLRAAMNRSLVSKIGAFLARGAFEALKEKMDPRELNGGVFLGLNGIVIKSHGGADAMGFASAIDVGYDMANSGLVERLAKDIQQFQPVLELGRTA
ncbi:MAG: phosphate acyltransferase PlsX [Hyphomicrobiales bacterium]